MTCPQTELRNRATIISLAGPRSHVRRLSREPTRSFGIDDRVWWFTAGLAVARWFALLVQGNL